MGFDIKTKSFKIYKGYSTFKKSDKDKNLIISGTTI